MRLICGIVDFTRERPIDGILAHMSAALKSPHCAAAVETSRIPGVGFAVLHFNESQEGPVQTPDGLLAADLRLDYEQDLVSKHGSAVGQSQQELVAAVLAGPARDAARELHGDFACALWQPDSELLLLTRDAVGVRPICYACPAPGCILFASLPRAILASGLVEQRLDAEAFLGVVQRSAPLEQTIFSGILWVAPGCTIRFTRTGSVCCRYWQPGRIPRRVLSPQQAAAELRQLVQDAVSSRIPRMGPVATHLSGGLDSTAIAILLARQLRQQSRQVLGYSFLPASQDLALDQHELPYVAAALAQEPHLSSVPIHAPPRHGATRFFPDEYLSADPLQPEAQVCRDAAARGAPLIFSGWGGDEGITYNGRAALADAFLHGRWRYLRREFQAIRTRRGIAYGKLMRGEVLGKVFGRELVQALRRAENGSFGQISLNSFLLPGYSQRATAGSQRERNVRDNQVDLLRSSHLPAACTRWAVYGAQSGVAFTFPFLDRRLLEFALSLPPTLQLRGGYRRRVFRDAMAEILPEKVRWRDHKLTPMPLPAGGIVLQPEYLSPLLGRAEQHPLISSIFDVRKLRAALLRDERTPQPELAIPSLQAVSAIAFLEQNF